MKKIYILFLGLLAITVLATVSYEVSYSLFTDTSSNNRNIFQAAAQFPQPSSTVPPVSRTLVINEVLYNTDCPQSQNKQWIELWNGSASQVDLKDWSLMDQEGNTIQIVNSVTLLDPGKLALLSKASATWNDQCYGNLLPGTVMVNLGGKISIGTMSGIIRLLDKNLAVVDRIDYGTYSGLTAGRNRSLERKILGSDTASGDGFAVSDFEVREPATAGFALPSTPTVVINEFLVQPSNGNKDWVEIYNKSGFGVDISGWTLRDTTGTFYTIPASTTIAASGFLVTPDFSNRLNDGGDKIYL